MESLKKKGRGLVHRAQRGVLAEARDKYGSSHTDPCKLGLRTWTLT